MQHHPSAELLREMETWRLGVRSRPLRKATTQELTSFSGRLSALRFASAVLLDTMTCSIASRGNDSPAADYVLAEPGDLSDLP
jgi:hypothetical protein